jgi:hypothetical protein
MPAIDDESNRAEPRCQPARTALVELRHLYHFSLAHFSDFLPRVTKLQQYLFGMLAMLGRGFCRLEKAK